MVKCYGFKSDPEDIEVRVGDTVDSWGRAEPAVIIEDPDGETYALHPGSARERARLVEKQAEGAACSELANRIYTVADRVEDMIDRW